MDAQSSSRCLTYEIQSNGIRLYDASANSNWTFHVPDSSEEPRIAYASCNGFSSAKLIKKTAEPYYLWERMCEEHKKDPLSLLIMGGDQLYADEIWESSLAPTVVDWSELSRSKRISYSATATLANKVDCFCVSPYVKRWSNRHLAHLMGISLQRRRARTRILTKTALDVPDKQTPNALFQIVQFDMHGVTCFFALLYHAWNTNLVEEKNTRRNPRFPVQFFPDVATNVPKILRGSFASHVAYVLYRD